MWEVWYGLEAANYLADNGALVTDLFWATESLAETDGWPQDGYYQQEDELVTWHIAGHLVVYRRLENEQIVQVVVLKPD
jgi:hypothetical protein